MVILGKWGDRPITISVKPNCITVSVDDPTRATVCSYDYAGRLWTAFFDEVSYRRGLDGKVLAKWGTLVGERQRRWLFGGEALAVERRARQTVASMYEALQNGDAALDTPLPEAGQRVIERAIAFDDDRSQADAAHYFEVYKPVGILPPDQYMAVVLQATEGCSFNTCTFCDFYKDRPFRIKSVKEFRIHALAVRDFLGKGLSLRRTIFLGDANALVVPMKRLVPLFEVVHDTYDVEALGGIYAFLDGFSGERKSVEDYARLRALGLQRVYIGMESGHDPLLQFLNKPSTAADSVAAVRAMKQAGVAVGVIILLGAGGHHYASGHVHDTIRWLNTMSLDGDDIVYFSELVVSDEMAYARDAVQARLDPLDAAERAAQGEVIEQGLRFRGESRPPVSRYDIREFVY
jgi:hypothetical protein